MAESCASCIHHQGMYQICSALAGHLWCGHCRQPWKLREESGWSPECPKCGRKGEDKAVEVVAGGRPPYCPGFEEKPGLKPPAVQGELF